MKPYIQNLLIIALVILCFIIGCNYSVNNRIEDHNQALINALTDSIKTYQRKDSAWVSERKAIVATAATLKTLVNSKDKLIADLAKQVSKNTPVLIGHQTTTQITSSGAPTIDTTKNDSPPTYRYAFQNQWQYGSVEAGPKLVQLNITSINDFRYSIEWKKAGLFKPREAQIQVINLNPTTVTKDVRALVVQAPKATVKEKTIIGSVLIGIGIVIGQSIKK